MRTHRSGAIIKRIALATDSDSDSTSSESSAGESSLNNLVGEMAMSMFSDGTEDLKLNSKKKCDPYAWLMQERIRQLPLPLTLQIYININRDLD